jgi:hypothetical protein
MTLYFQQTVNQRGEILTLIPCQLLINGVVDTGNSVLEVVITHLNR